MSFEEFGGESSEMGARTPDTGSNVSVIPCSAFKKVGVKMSELIKKTDPDLYEKLLLQCKNVDMSEDADGNKFRINIDMLEDDTLFSTQEKSIKKLLKKIDSLEEYIEILKDKNKHLCIMIRQDNNQKRVNQLERENEALKRENELLIARTTENTF